MTPGIFADLTLQPSAWWVCFSVRYLGGRIEVAPVLVVKNQKKRYRVEALRSDSLAVSYVVASRAPHYIGNSSFFLCYIHHTLLLDWTLFPRLFYLIFLVSYHEGGALVPGARSPIGYCPNGFMYDTSRISRGFREPQFI